MRESLKAPITEIKYFQTYKKNVNIKIFKTASSYIRIQQSYIASRTAHPTVTSLMHRREGYQSKNQLGENRRFILKTNSLTLNMGHKRTR